MRTLVRPAAQAAQDAKGAPQGWSNRHKRLRNLSLARSRKNRAAGATHVTAIDCMLGKQDLPGDHVHAIAERPGYP
jgi:hypothetical protein